MEFWKKHFDNNAEYFKNSLKKQVDMTVNGKEVDESQVDLRVETIVKGLSLEKQDIILDVCCGNGMITKRLSAFVSRIYGIDFSKGLIDIARKVNTANNIEYHIGDFANISMSKFSDVNKINVYSGLQYVDINSLKMFLKNISMCKKPLTIYFGNVPDKEKIWNFYDTEYKKEFYFKREQEGMPHLGTWWDKNEIESIVSNFGFTIRFLKINKKMNTSYYRFDVLIKKGL